MKHLDFILCGSVLLLGTLPARAAAQYFPLACRGPLSLTAFQRMDPDGNGAVSRHLLIVPVVASRTAAGIHVEGLQPGTCAWLDRPLRDDEPRVLRMYFDLIEGLPHVSHHEFDPTSYPDPLEAMAFSCSASSTCVLVVMATAAGIPAGVAVDSSIGHQRRASPESAALWSFAHWGDSAWPMAFVRLDGPGRPDLSLMTSDAAVQVVLPPGDSLGH